MKTKTLTLIFFISCIIFAPRSYGQLMRAVIKNSLKPSVNTLVAPVTITSINPVQQYSGETVTIIGSNFAGTRSVMFGGTSAASFTVVSPTTITAVVAGGTTGNVTVITGNGMASFPGFIFLPGIKPPAAGINSPNITSFNPTAAAQGETVTIVGTDLDNVTSVSIGNVAAINFTVLSSTSISAVVPATASGSVSVASATGASSFPGFTFNTAPAAPAGTSPGASPQAGADFTLPEVGQSNLNIIVTPSFLLTKVYDAKYGFSGTFWGNALGIDSVKQKVANKFILPQSSIIGVKIEGAYSFTDPKQKGLQVGVAGEFNILYKKVAYFDTASKVSTNFTPFVFHPKVGLVFSLANGNVMFAYRYNLLAVMNDNDQFSKFFNTKSKSSFGFPEYDFSYIFDVSDASKQSIKISIITLQNNSDIRSLTGSTDKLIPYLQIGFVSKL